MKVVKRTNDYIYVRLGNRDMDSTMGASDLVRVERGLISDGYTLSDAVKCDGRGEEIDYPDEWVVKDDGAPGFFRFAIPNDVDEQLKANPSWFF